MGRKFFYLLIIVTLCLFCGQSFAANPTDESVLGNDRFSVDSSGNLVPNADASYDLGSSSYKLDAGYFSGDLTFKSLLTAVGRGGGVSTVASSSTNLAPANLPYVVLIKMTYGAGSLDLVPGTTLQNGTPGQILVLYLRGVNTGGGWKITPTTSKTFTTLTLDTAADTVMLLYVNDTVGWIILQNEGCTVTLPASFANDFGS